MTHESESELTDEEKTLLYLWAEEIVTIPEGGKVGKWTRESRVMLVYSVLCSLCRIKMRLDCE